MNRDLVLTVEITEATVRQAIAEFVLRQLRQPDFIADAADVTIVVEPDVTARDEILGYRVSRARVTLQPHPDVEE